MHSWRYARGVARGGDLDWDDLRYFLRAAEARSLSGAARASGVEHTTVSRRLTSLERSLGAALVLRGPDGLELTPLGERVAPLVEEMQRAAQAVRDLAGRSRARVRLALPSGFPRLFTAGLPQLRRAHPTLSLELLSGARPVDLVKGEADLALRGGTVTGDELVARKLCDSGSSLYASESYLARHPGPLRTDDLAGHEVIGFDRSLAAQPAARWLEARAARATVVLRSREMVDMVTAAASGLGLAVLPCVLADGEPLLVRLVPEVVATTPLSLVYRREARLSAEIRAVIRFVVEVVADSEARIAGRRR